MAEDLDKGEPEAAVVRGVLYDADAHDQEIELDARLLSLSVRQLLWIDVQRKVGDPVALVAALNDLNPATAFNALGDGAYADRHVEHSRLPLVSLRRLLSVHLDCLGYR